MHNEVILRDSHLPQDGDMRSRNKYEAEHVYNTLSYTYAHFLVSLPHLIPERTSTDVVINQLPSDAVLRSRQCHGTFHVNKGVKDSNIESKNRFPNSKFLLTSIQG
jgi:hypothetical protein